MDGQFESDKQGILQPPAYTAEPIYYPQQPPPSTQTVVHVSLPQTPPDYFAFSIIVTIFCCIPFGFVAFIKSREVRSQVLMGDVAGAQLSSLQAKKWSYTALFTGIGIYVTIFLFYFVWFLLAI